MTQTAIEARSDTYVTRVQRISRPDSNKTEIDILAVEEPLEIRLGYTENEKFRHRAVSVTMRTPGNDFELAAGFLFTEGVLVSPRQISGIKHCGKFPHNRNTVRVDLQSETSLDFKKLERNFYTTSSCGVCGKSSLEAIRSAGAKRIETTNFLEVSAATIHALPEKLREKQAVFEETGGLHAAALFDGSGNLLEIREDVGRHNAVDKLIGASFLSNELPLRGKILFLSGRASFELIQKAAMAQIEFVCAVGAPSSLAVEAAREFNITLLGFVRDSRFNVYSGTQRIRFAS